jgi:tRNA (cmo5U34)-methyltransferase
VGDAGDVETERNDFEALSFPDGTFDLILSSISLHHLADPDKPPFYARVHRWLGSGGFFAFSDQFAGATKDIHARHIEGWRKASATLGASEEEWKEWMAHQEAHDHHARLHDHLRWLREAGFDWIDCPWRHLLWTVLIAGKEGEIRDRA